MYACIDAFRETIGSPMDRIVYVAIDVFVIKCQQIEFFVIAWLEIHVLEWDY